MLSDTEYWPSRIIQIASGSRCGSSLLKTLLAGSSDVVFLDGEEEPYIKMSGNGYGMTSDDDSFTKVVNPQLFRKMVYTELHCPEQRWEWRLQLQYRGEILSRLLEDLPRLKRLESKGGPFGVQRWLDQHRIRGHYDGCPPGVRAPVQDVVYEMAPFVLPTYRRSCPTGKVLLLKSPYNAYREQILEQLFPGVPITRVILTRNPAATINGLIDGWAASYGFYKHLTPYGWWKFDLPPGWVEFVGLSTVNKAWLQWYSSYTRLVHRQGFVVQFEELIQQPSVVLNKLCRQLEIEPPTLSKELPKVMSTESPTKFRWKNSPQREKAILNVLSTHPESLALCSQLGYKEQSQWA